MSKIFSLGLLILVVITMIFTGCSSTKPAATPPAPVSLKIGSLPRIFDLIAYTAQQEGLFKKHNLNVEIVNFRSDVEMTNALLVGELDGLIQGPYAAVNMNKDKVSVKLVGHNFMPRMFEVVVSAGSGITSPSQLKGRQVAVSTSTVMEYALDEMLKSQGMTGKDVVYVNVPSIPLRLEMLNQGKVAAAVLTSPSSDLAVLTGNKIILDDTQQLLGGPGLIFSMNALNTKSEGVGWFIQSWQEAVDLVNTDPGKYHGLLINVSKAAESVAAGIAVPRFPKLRLPAQNELDSIMNWMLAKGLISQPLSYAKIVETKYLK